MTDKMNHPDDQELQRLLRREFPPVDATELQRDLWPRMLRRLETQPQPRRVPWFDWALVAAVAALLLLFPSAIPALLYQL